MYNNLQDGMVSAECCLNDTAETRYNWNLIPLGRHRPAGLPLFASRLQIDCRIWFYGHESDGTDGGFAGGVWRLPIGYVGRRNHRESIRSLRKRIHFTHRKQHPLADLTPSISLATRNFGELKPPDGIRARQWPVSATVSPPRIAGQRFGN